MREPENVNKQPIIDLLPNSKEKIQTRNVWVDYGKGIGIFLVVLGHVIRSLVSSSMVANSLFLQGVDNWIYAFHIPLFFFLSGLFVNRSVTKPFPSFFINKLQVIAYPYFLWSIIQTILQIILGKYTNNEISIDNLWRIIYEPVMQFWFFYSLFIITLVYAGLSKLGVRPKYIFLLSVCFYYSQFFNISLGNWGVIYQVREQMIYFALGALIGSSQIINKSEQWQNKQFLMIVIGGFLCLTLGILLDIQHIVALVPFLAFSGLFASIAVAILLNRYKMFPFLQNWGKLSLQIYVAHTIASAGMRIFLLKVLNISDIFVHLTIGTLFGIYIPILLDYICQYLHLPYLFILKKNN
ncbi:MAG: acyltransferase family protein [Microcoleaceae cyanobacterium]